MIVNWINPKSQFEVDLIEWKQISDFLSLYIQYVYRLCVVISLDEDKF